MTPPPPARPRSAPRRAPAAPLLLAAVLAACAGASSGGPVADPMANAAVTTRVEGARGTSEVRAVVDAVATAEAPVAAAPDKVFATLASVYDAFGVPVNTVLSDTRTVGARDARMPRRLGKVPLSQYLDCGTSAAGGAPLADSYAVIMTVLTRVAPTPDGTSNVVTQVAAQARPITVAGNAVQCSSTGRLEGAINKRLAAEAAK